MSVETRINRGYSERDLDNAMEAIHFALLQQDEVEDAVTSFDDGTIASRVVLSIGTPADSALRDLRRLSGEMLVQDKSNLADYISVTVDEVESTDELGGEEISSYHYGGEVISGCTPVPDFCINAPNPLTTPNHMF